MVFKTVKKNRAAWWDVVGRMQNTASALRTNYLETRYNRYSGEGDKLSAFNDNPGACVAYSKAAMFADRLKDIDERNKMLRKAAVQSQIYGEYAERVAESIVTRTYIEDKVFDHVQAFKAFTQAAELKHNMGDSSFNKNIAELLHKAEKNKTEALKIAVQSGVHISSSEIKNSIHVYENLSTKLEPEMRLLRH